MNFRAIFYTFLLFTSNYILAQNNIGSFKAKKPPVFKCPLDMPSTYENGAIVLQDSILHNYILSQLTFPADNHHTLNHSLHIPVTIDFYSGYAFLNSNGFKYPKIKNVDSDESLIKSNLNEQAMAIIYKLQFQACYSRYDTTTHEPYGKYLIPLHFKWDELARK